MRTALLLTLATCATFACGTSHDSRDQTNGAMSPALPANVQDATPGAARDGGVTPVPGDGSPPSPPPATMILSAESLKIAGETRGFALASPSSYDPGKSYPLVLVLHGDGGDGPSMRDGTRFHDVSGQGAFVAYPSGRNQGWNLYDAPETNSDLAFLVTLVETLTERLSIDASRVFATGFSSGAFMINQVACRRPGFFRGIAPLSGGAPNEPNDPRASYWPNGYTRCRNQTMGSGPATLVVHGTADGTVTYDSGNFTATYWAYINGCTSARVATTPASCAEHRGCPQGKPVVLCSIPNLGHAIWSGANQTAWSFFEAL